MHMYSEMGKDLYLDLDASDIARVIRTRTTPVNRSRTGYGSKLPTSRMIEGIDGRRRRIYAICYSNCATLYVLIKGKTVVCETAINDYELAHAKA